MKDSLFEGAKVLDVGSGSGYSTALLYEMVKSPDSKETLVVGIEHIDPLVTMSKENLIKSYDEEIESNKIKIVNGDGRKGYPENAPYDVIHVDASSLIVPDDLIK